MEALAGFLDLRQRALAKAPADPGSGLCRALSDAMDAAVRTRCAGWTGDFAVLALGGYGRRDLCLFSDIDLMVLHDGRPAQQQAEALFYPLWDAGLKVGHAVRTVEESLAAAGDLASLTALLDARLICGSDALLHNLHDRLWRRIARRRQALIAALRAAEAERRAAEPYQLQQPDIKEGRGGLRSAQRLRWLHLFGGERRQSADNPLIDTAAAYETLLRARNALHAAAGRAQNVWLADLWPQACAWLGEQIDEACARLYLAMRTIDRACLAAFEQPPSREPSRWFRVRGRQHRTVESVSNAGGSLAGRSVLQHAGLLAHADTAPLLDPETARAIIAAPGASWTQADRDGLFALLASGERGQQIFDDLARLGWWERSLPEWRHVRGLPQQPLIHLHPVDTHLWRTVSEAVALAEGRADTWYREIAHGLGALDDLLLAALFHDLGKGWPGDHAETGAAAANAICRRMRLDADTRYTVVAAVRQHLLLPLVATRRDIADERVIEDVADRVTRPRTLDVLLLLSVADSRATGPAVWGPWKESLLRALYERVAHLLALRSGATPLSQAPPDARARVLALAEGRVPPAALAAHLDGLPPGYLQAFSAEEVLRHLALATPPPREGETRLDAREHGGAYDLALALKDRPGLIALVTGVLALHNLSVLEGRFFTRADGVALQTLRLVDVLANVHGEGRWQRIAADLQHALRGELAVEQRLAEKARAYRRPRGRTSADVRIEQTRDGAFTVLEVHAADRVGLLHLVARTLYACGLDIHFAKADTQGHDVVDVFYVRDVHGAPLRDGERLRAVRATLLSALAG